MSIGSGPDIYVGWFIKGWKDIPPEQRRNFLERARYDVYKPGRRAIKRLISVSCCAFVLVFGVFALFPLLWFENVLFGVIGAAPAVAIFLFISSLLHVYLIKNRLKQLIHLEIGT